MSAVPTPQPEPEGNTPNDPHQLTLVKNGQRYVFHCEPGQEPELLQQLAELATNPDSELDWFDAAVLSHQVGARINHRLQNHTLSPPQPGCSSNPNGGALPTDQDPNRGQRDV